MKYRFQVLIYLVLSSLNLNAQDDLVELPIAMKDGYGPFLPGYNGISWKDSAKITVWSKTYHTLKGIPLDWKYVKQGRMVLDEQQFAYQNFKMGNITDSFYEELQTDWHWTPDEKILSVKPIKCFIYVITGIDSEGHHLVRIDSNNNLDFSDEQSFNPPNLFYGIQPDITNKVRCQYEHYKNNRIISSERPISIWHYLNGLMCSFPFYAVAPLPKSKPGSYIAVVSAGFSNPNFLNFSATVVNDTSLNDNSSITSHKKIIPKFMSKENEYIKLDSNTYQLKGVNLAKNILTIKKVSNIDSLYSTQKGYNAYPFSGIDILNNKNIDLKDFRGKYILVDFWGTWCAPCLAEMPRLKELYSKTSRSQIEFIGIVSNDVLEKLKAYLIEENITWPQILSTKNNKIVETYQVRSYPNMVLIDPKGKVVNFGLNASNIAEILGKLLKK